MKSSSEMRKESHKSHGNSNRKFNVNETHITHKYTWRQVAERNNEKEAWIIVRDKVYDVSGNF